MSKQTAVNFLIKEFSDILGPLETKPMQDLLMMDAMKKAKEMEKEQLLSFARLYDDDLSEGKIRSREDLYRETYGK